MLDNYNLLCYYLLGIIKHQFEVATFCTVTGRKSFAILVTARALRQRNLPAVYLGLVRQLPEPEEPIRRDRRRHPANAQRILSRLGRHREGGRRGARRHRSGPHCTGSCFEAQRIGRPQLGGSTGRDFPVQARVWGFEAGPIEVKYSTTRLLWSVLSFCSVHSSLLKWNKYVQLFPSPGST